MKRKLQVLGMIIFVFTSMSFRGYSQSFEMLSPKSAIDTVSGESDLFELESHSELKNITSDTISFKIAVTPVTYQEGHSYLYCDLVTCYSVNGFVAHESGVNKLAGGATTGESFYIGLLPNEVDGISELNVKYFMVDNPSDNISYNALFFVGTTGIKESQMLIISPEYIMPNPATDLVEIGNLNNISHSGATLNVYDIHGNILTSENLYPGVDKYNLNTANYNNGTYYFIISNSTEKSKAGKFIIER